VCEFSFRLLVELDDPDRAFDLDTVDVELAFEPVTLSVSWNRTAPAEAQVLWVDPAFGRVGSMQVSTE
jgi:hypothetical protein